MVLPSSFMGYLGAAGGGIRNTELHRRTGSVTKRSVRLPTVRHSTLLLLALAGCGPSFPEVERPVDWASPTFGSGGFAYAAGNAFPGAMVPDGMVKLGPDTTGKQYGAIEFLHYDGYWYGDDTVRGFSHLHLAGTGATDLGVLSVMPALSVDAASAKPDGLATALKKPTERATPGSYEVTLANGIAVALTATVHTGAHRYTFPADATTGVIAFDLAHHLSGGVINAASLDVTGTEVSGHFHQAGKMSRGFGGMDVFFVARATRAPLSSKVWSATTALADGTHAEGDDVGCALTFDTTQPVELTVAVSLVSVEGARANLDAEVGAFETVRTAAVNAWNEQLSAVKLSGGGEDERRLFYSALHHVFVMPAQYQDVDGRYRGHDGQVHTTDGARFVSDLSLWDSYRTVHPLYGLLAPSLARDAVKSLHLMAQQHGAFPKWPLAAGDSGSMVGASAEVVVADAYARGVRDFDAEDAYQVLRAAALGEAEPAGGRGGRDHVTVYDALGFVPSTGDNGATSVTCEYAHDDFALSNLAAALGHDDDAARLLARSKGYRKLYDPVTGFLRARTADGALAVKTGFDPLVLSDEYVEANAWHTLFCAPHDVDGMVDLLGGQQAFLDRLTSFFEQSKTEWEGLASDSLLRSLPRPYYWQANEPDIHAAYLFAQAGRPALTQRWARWVADTFYAPRPDGLPGNDDGGTMSAWYVFTALGLYPLAGSDQFILGAPRFPKAVLRLPGGTFTIDAPQASSTNLFVQSVTLDGQPLTTPVLRMGQLKPGGRLAFVMGPTPSHWGER
jgi:predicted alpha-1,2-mannosidase